MLHVPLLGTPACLGAAGGGLWVPNSWRFCERSSCAEHLPDPKCVTALLLWEGYHRITEPLRSHRHTEGHHHMWTSPMEAVLTEMSQSTLRFKPEQMQKRQQFGEVTAVYFGRCARWLPESFKP